MTALHVCDLSVRLIPAWPISLPLSINITSHHIPICLFFQLIDTLTSFDLIFTRLIDLKEFIQYLNAVCSFVCHSSCFISLLCHFFILSAGSDLSSDMCLCTPQLLSRLQKVMEGRVISCFYLIALNFPPRIVSGVCQIIKSSPTGVIFISEHHLTSVCSMESKGIWMIFVWF